MLPEAVGPQIQLLDPSMTLEGTVITGGVLGGSLGSSSSGGSSGAHEESPSRDLVKGKASAVTKEKTMEVPAREVEFQPAVGSSGHRPITQGDFAKFVDEAVLDQLLRENPAVVAAVLSVREDR